MSNLIHSFYGHNRNALEFDHKREDFIIFYQNCYFCLSSIYAAQSGFNIDLYTNYEFGQLLDAAPYKDIHNVFEDHDEYAKIDPKIWAWPKFIALDMAPRDSIHIDGDVFLKDKKCKKHLNFNGYDVIVQHAETYDQSVYFKEFWTDTFESIKHLDFPTFIDKNVPESMYNNGVLGVRNKVLWNKYRDAYWYMYNQCEKGTIVKDKNSFCVPDIIFEQYFLKQMCDKGQYAVKSVLDGVTNKELCESAIKKHYQHICGDKIKRLHQCINLIRKKNIKCYQMLKSNWGDKYPEYFTYE